MSTNCIGSAVCSVCGCPNSVDGLNTVVDQTVSRPELNHLRVTCRFCSNDIPVWASRSALATAEALGFRVDPWHFIRRWVVEKYGEVLWVHRLGPDQQEAVAELCQLLQDTSPEDWENELKAGQSSNVLPLLWNCDCGCETGCQPELSKVVGNAPLRAA